MNDSGACSEYIVIAPIISLKWQTAQSDDVVKILVVAIKFKKKFK